MQDGNGMMDWMQDRMMIGCKMVMEELIFKAGLILKDLTFIVVRIAFLFYYVFIIKLYFSIIF